LKALIQRVSEASVTVNNERIGQIDKGILILLGVEKDDNHTRADKLLKKILGYRIFPDESGRMNLNVQQARGGLLIVSQFTLVADTTKGLRPGFSNGANPQHGKQIYDYLVDQAQSLHPLVATGQFGADMKVSLLNDGPVTFWLES
jgi:D-tyrosyl-tRNA(Tyr) deacylase